MVPVSEVCPFFSKIRDALAKYYIGIELRNGDRMSNDENHMGNIIAGVMLGGLIGGSVGLGACIFIFEEPPFFTGDTVLTGALACGVLGYVRGEGFVEWLKEGWWYFW